jgi:hypothetical protein
VTNASSARRVAERPGNASDDRTLGRARVVRCDRVRVNAKQRNFARTARSRTLADRRSTLARTRGIIRTKRKRRTFRKHIRAGST